ncbi:MAG: hypothetical protein ACLQVN_03845 [Bryobacteraceae bacterium]
MAANKPDPRETPEVEHYDVDNPAQRHERRDVNVKAISEFAIGLALLCIASFAIVVGVFRYLEHVTSGVPAGKQNVAIDARQRPPAPQLEETPAIDLQRERAAEEELLHTYGWIDKPGGVVRLPIERAIDLMAQRGLPSRAEAPPPSNVSVPSEAGLGPKVQQQGGPLAPELGGR